MIIPGHLLALHRQPKPRAVKPVLKPYPQIAHCRLRQVCFLLLWVISQPVFSQSLPPDSAAPSPIYPGKSFYSLHTGTAIDTVWWVYKGQCKATNSGKHIIPPGITPGLQPAKAVLPITNRQPLLTVHGNVHYGYLYRSFVDTPFAQNDFQQHTVQTFLNIVVKEKYPINLAFSNRVSNSPYFRNFFDLNLHFDQTAFQRNIKQELLNRIAALQLKAPDLVAAQQALEQELEKFNALKAYLTSPDLLQRLVEEKERIYHRQKAAAETSIDSAAEANTLGLIQRYKMRIAKKITDVRPGSGDSSYYDLAKQKQAELDSAGQKLYRLKAKTDSLKNNIEKKLQAYRQKIYKATRPGELRNIESDSGLEPGKRKGLDKFISNVKGVGIGRSVINYSELTAWNVSLTGFHLEYNPRMYTALAAGKIDYGFRDFLGRNTRQKGQNFLMGRIGLGDIERKAIIFSGFAGRKFNYGSGFIDTVSDYVNIVGYSLEAVWKKDADNGISAELAKTTRPLSGRLRDNNGMKSLFVFGDNANLGISIKGNAKINKTNTILSGFFRKTGENFQSFSLFTYNTDQTAWLLRTHQPLFKEKLSITGMLRRNDFVNPFSEKTFKTSTVFKSIQLTMRIPKWPVLSAGYYPGTQLYIVDRERIRENAYYILNGSVVYNYAAWDTRMVSSLIYNRFSGKGTDSGFIAYSGVNYVASQVFVFSKAQVQAGYTFTDQEQMQFYTLEANADYSLWQWLRAGVGIRYNKIPGGEIYTGSRAQLILGMGKLGGLQLQYEKSYLPTIWQTLYPVETGTVSWFKYF